MNEQNEDKVVKKCYSGKNSINLSCHWCTLCRPYGVLPYSLIVICTGIYMSVCVCLDEGEVDKGEVDKDPEEWREG